MAIPLAVQSAQYEKSCGGHFVRLTLNDGTTSSVYLEDGSPPNQLHDMLDAWIAAGNQIAPADQ